jgi:hypothetical protein
VEEAHLAQGLEGLKLLILPRVVVMEEPVAQALAAFVRRGGTLLVESETGAFGTNGIYRDPDDRFFAELTGAREVGRRQLKGGAVTLALGDASFMLPAAQWLTPLVERSWMPGTTDESEARLLQEVELGAGRVLLCATYLGDAYLQAAESEAGAFEAFLAALAARSGVVRPVTVVSSQPVGGDFVHVRMGAAPGPDASLRPVVFVFTPSPETQVELAFHPGTFGESVRDLLSGAEIAVTGSESAQTVVLGPTEWGISVLVGG